MKKRRQEPVPPPLEQLLGPYVMTRVPHTIHEALKNVRCGRCGHVTLYDARRPAPSKCAWCEWELERRIVLEP